MSINATDFAKNWSSGLSGKGIAKYTASIAQVQTSPGAKAAEKESKYLDSVTSAVSSGRYRSGQLSYSLQHWKDAASGAGRQGLLTAANSKAGKVQSFATKFLPVLNQISAQTRALPNNTEAERDQRMLAQSQAMRKTKGSFKG